MSSPEHIFHESQIVFAPDGKTGEEGSEQIGPKDQQSPRLNARDLTQGENLSPDAHWTLDFLYNLGYTMYLSDRAEMRSIDLAAGLDELRNNGLLDESDPQQPKVAKQLLDKGFRQKLEEALFVEREGQEGGELSWGERLSSNAFWIFDYLQGIGATKHLAELAKSQGIDLDAGLEELRNQGLLDESSSAYPQINLPQPKLLPP